MSTFRRWAFWRRLQYATGFILTSALCGVVVYYTQFYAAPTCLDGLQNGLERGIDCDGGCKRICAVSVIPPQILWSESFPVVDGQYNATAYIENKNQTAGTPELRYTFTLLEKGTVIAERSGQTVLPPNSVYPIFEGRILTTDSRIPDETKITLEPIETWLPATIGRTQFKVADLNLTGIDTRPRLVAKVENTELTAATDVEVVATIFDRNGKALTTSQTFIDSFAPRTTEEIVFTWPNSIAKTVRSCEVASDIMLVLDRSGSMAAGGGTPPEPLQSAKQAAQNFIEQVLATTQIGFVSYATTPTTPMELLLTKNKEEARQAIASVAMGEDGVQYTNMGDAFKVALQELQSERHNNEARKVIIFMTDGDVTRPVNPQTNLPDRTYAANYAREQATAAKADGVTVYSIGFGESLASSTADTQRDASLIKDLASAPDLYFTAPTVADLEKVYQEIAIGLCEEGPTRIEVIPKTRTNFQGL